MAGSRIHRVGSIFSRTEGLLKSGALSEKPIWFDVYRAFGPQIEPKLSRPLPDQQLNQLKDILYPEDVIRARFYSTFGGNGLIDNLKQITKNYKSVSQTFIERYVQIARSESNPNLDDHYLFEKTTRALTQEGVRLKQDLKRADRQDSDRADRADRQAFDSNRKRALISEIALSDD